MNDFILNTDFHILNFIHANFSCSFLDWLMPKITFLGNYGLIWIAAAIIMLSIQKHRKNGIVLSIGLLCGLIIGNLILKNLIARERPCWINDSVQLLIGIPDDYSFPSGHTLSAFVAATVLFSCNKKLGAAAFLLAASIAFSRLYLYVHFPTDVLCGIIFGVLIGAVVVRLTKPYFNI